MGLSPKILAFAGSTRAASFNKKLVKLALTAAREAGAEVTYLDLKELPMPLYDGDDEASQGLPENAKRFKALLKAHHGFLISAPEYNSSISGVLKNSIDWASRKEEGEAPLECFGGKIAGLMSASPGSLGGLRGLVTLRSILENIGVWVIPHQVAIPKAHEAFDEAGGLKDPKSAKDIAKIAVQVTQAIQKLKAE